MKISIYQKLAVLLASAIYSAGSAATVSQSPLFLTTSVDPNVLFNMSVETPMGGAAYNDQPDGGSCGGRVSDGGTVGICYFPTEEYLGYFDPNKCYNYSSGRFVPAGATTTDHECSGQFSGNFMNWATMTAMDMFVWTMTGGNRVTDTTSETVIRRTRKQNNDSWFPHKLIKSSRNVSPSTVTPWSSPVYIYNTDFGVQFGTARGGSDLGTYDVKLRVCDLSAGLEANCAPYVSGGSTYYKPEGLVQENADHMRFGVTSYTNTNGNGIDGGVLRSNMKYVGTTMPDGSGGTITNPNAEIDTSGFIVTNPNPVDASESGVSKSGVIPYLNKFSDASYKGNDPASELFYESIRYFKNLGPTSEYLSGATGGFPIINNSGSSRWEDPIQYECQKNFIVGINDANPWADKRLPGTHFTSASAWPAAGIADFGAPSSPDPDINVTTLTNKVGDLEGLTGTSQCIGCTSATCDFLSTNKIITGLGEVFGTCPYTPKENSYYIAGLAYYANTEDIRTGTGGATDFPGKQTIATFMIDTQEYGTDPLVGQMNMLWLAGKYGGFIDENDNDEPDLASEWDADGDGEPDNYVLATKPDKLVASLNRAFDEIEARTASSSSAATNSTRLDAGSKVYQARFSSANWTGQLLAFDLDDATGDVDIELWDASTLLPSESSRKIYSFDPAAGAGIEFEYSNLNGSQQLAMDTDAAGVPGTSTEGEDRVDFIRGDQSKEIGSGGGSGTFRTRDSVLGDIVNSDPWFQGTDENFGYDVINDDDEAGKYPAFRITKLTRTPTVFVGANDGMLHAFNADTGVELFSYVPSGVISNLSLLTDPNYGCDGVGCYAHRYFVDGSPRSADVYFGSGASGSWHTVLVGTLGAGGKGVFALDVTNPAAFTETKVLWEISTASHSDFANHLGFTLPQASIVKLNNGDWAAVVANGYESASQEAALFLIDIEDGSLIKTFDTGVGGPGSPNGLSTPIAIDQDGDRVTDFVYAGDLLGNLWKFDLTGGSAGSWKIAYKSGGTNLPLYKAEDGSGNPQPITAKPQVGAHPDGGLMVYFGTGKYFEVNDQIVGTPPKVQTFYGIRDEGSEITTSDRSNLQEQEILDEVTLASFGIDVRITSDTDVIYEPPGTTKQGWFMDLVSPVVGAEGERVVSAPLLRSGRIIFPTLIPNQDPCDAGGSSWLMELDAVSGSRLATSPFDVDGDGDFDEDDYVAFTDASGTTDVPVSGIRRHGLGIIKTPGVITCADGTECKYVSGTKGGLEMITESANNPTGRQAWRQLR